jgi:tetratricopeptide (TPR) repeat protein
MKGPQAAIAAALVIVLLAPAASAGPEGVSRAQNPVSSVWERARRPQVVQERELVAEAESYELRYHQLGMGHPVLDRAELAVLGDMYLARAAELLEKAGADTSRDLFLRYRLASVYAMRQKSERAVALLESIARAEPPAPLRAAVFADLAVAYARLGRVEDEIEAYGESLRVQPLAHERSRLFANRAEAYMLLGHITSAVAGYRAALALLSSDYLMFGGGPTTLWGLAVALDRSGDLDSGLDAVRLARTYDPKDEQINGPGWFYMPAYDRHWYEALGHWQVGRKVDVVTAVRADAYGRAVASWEEYVANAARADQWLPLARVRLSQCETERAAFFRSAKILDPSLRKALTMGAPPSNPRLKAAERAERH